MAARSSKFQVLPIEKEPLLFSLALCIRTRPDFLTAIIMTRCFLFVSGDVGGGADEGEAASSITFIWVM